MENINFLKTLTLLLLFLIITSCAAKKEGVQIEGKSASEILRKVELYEGAVRSVKGFAKVGIKTPDSKVSYTQVTLAEKPDLIRLEALNPFGKAVGFISSDGTNIYIISPSERGVYDSSTRFDLAYVYPGLNLEITAQNLVNLVLGRLPENVYDLNSNPALSTENGLVRLDFKTRSTSDLNTLWVNSLNSRVEKAEFALRNGTKAEISYQYFDNLIDGFYFPQKIDFSSEGLSISILYDPDIELNTSIDRRLFKPAVDITKLKSDSPNTHGIFSRL